MLRAWRKAGILTVNDAKVKLFAIDGYQLSCGVPWSDSGNYSTFLRNVFTTCGHSKEWLFGELL